MSKRKIKPESTVVEMAGSLLKKSKIIPKDPFEGRYKSMTVDIPNLSIFEAFEKLFKTDSTLPFKFEVTSYHYEQNGVTKYVCGENLFVEESKTQMVVTYESDKQEEMIALLNERFPACTCVNK